MKNQSIRTTVRDFVSDIERKQRITRAIAFADCGRFQEALAMYEALPAGDRHFEDWDMMARIFTSISRHNDACDAWREAERAGMPSSTIQQCMDALQIRQYCTRLALVLMASLLLILTMLAIFVFVSIRYSI